MRVYVVVPTRNRPEMLAEAPASVRIQTFLDYEIIVVSNGEVDVESRRVASIYRYRYFRLDEGNASADRDTQRHLRDTPPSFSSFATPRLVGVLSPNWLVRLGQEERQESPHQKKI